jgi:DNA-binding winged helix-turn-helix (wHTH) protein
VSGRVAFGEFVLDLGTRELLREGRSVPLSPRAFKLLELLVRSRPKALSKTILLERLWPDAFVVDKNLTNVVAEIRRTLGDDPARPRFIRTVPRFGYAFREASSETGRAHGEASPAQFRLVWKGGRAALDDGEHVLGRDPDLELFFDSPSVSRRHARIVVSGAEVTIEDLASKNGTFVGDRQVGAVTRISDGETIRIGSVEVSLQAVLTPGSTETAAAARPAQRRVLKPI